MKETNEEMEIPKEGQGKQFESVEERAKAWRRRQSKCDARVPATDGTGNIYTLTMLAPAWFLNGLHYKDKRCGGGD